MKKLFLLAAAVISLSGCWFINQPKAVVIATDETRAQALIAALQTQNSELKASEVAVRLVGKNATADLMAGIKWATGKGVKTIGIDNDSYPAGDPQVGALLKILRDGGVYVAGMQFAG